MLITIFSKFEIFKDFWQQGLNILNVVVLFEIVVVGVNES